MYLFSYLFSLSIFYLFTFFFINVFLLFYFLFKFILFIYIRQFGHVWMDWLRVNGLVSCELFSHE